MFDDFGGPFGSTPNPALWSHWLSASADYLSAHTDYLRNAQQNNGNLALTAIRETVKDTRLPKPVRYTTAMLTTQGKFEAQYGTWSARIFMPPGKGHHPTFYLWGATYNAKTNPWPNCGEVDVIELQDAVQGISIHGPGYNWQTRPPTQISVAAPFDVRGGWHVYECRHEPDKLTIIVDDIEVAWFTPATLKGKRWVFNQPLFAVLDLSVGTGTNKPDGQPFPVSMLIDWIRHEPLEGTMSKDDYARAVITEGQRRNITPRGIVIALSTCLVESGLQMYANSKVPESLKLPHDAVGSDGLSVGLFQQQVKDTGNGWWWADCATCMNPTKSAGLFYDRLAKLNYNGPNTPGSYAQAVQQSAYPDRYDQHMSEAQKIYDRLAGAPAEEETAVGFTGDPVWLEDVLHAALGERLVVEGDWASRGTGGSMGDIWGVLIHHTGNDRETVAGIRDGRSDLSGPLSQCLITPDGKCHLIAVGPCNHAGIGSYPGIGANNGNQRLIGFECAWPTIRSDGSYDVNQRWPDAQIITMRDATAAVLKKLGADSTHVIGHKEWATKPPNVKWDPGNIDMSWFRGEVGKDIAGQFDPKPAEPPVVEQPKPSPTAVPPDWGLQADDQVRGRWEMLGWQTPTETLAEIRDHLTGSKDAGKAGFTRGDKPKSVS